MSLFGEIRHDFNRLREIVRVMSRFGFAPTLKRIPLVSRMVEKGTGSSPDLPVGERFANMLEELGPTFVKLGQILSTRGDLLPPAFTNALSRLQDAVPPFAAAEAVQQIERALGEKVEVVFSSFDETPLASASVAQVHAAVLRDGTEVVVEIQRPGIADRVQSDASILVLVASVLELLVQEASTYRAVDLAQEFEKALVNELDFSQEARNLSAFANYNAGREGVVVPALIKEHSSATVLTMTRVYGKRITSLKDHPDTQRTEAIIERMVTLGYEHFFVDGMFHGDPHPGNVLVTDDGDLAFIDFGLVGTIDRSIQDRLLLLVVALSLRDSDSISRLLLRIGEVTGRVSLTDFSLSINRLMERYWGASLADVDASRAMADLVDLSSRFGIRMPREFALFTKASVAFDGIVRQLHPNFEPSGLLTKRATELLFRRLDPRQLREEGMRTALQLGILMQDLPLMLSQTLLDLERGELTVQMSSSALDNLERNVRGLGMTVFGGLLSAACTLGGIFVLSRYDLEVSGVPVLPAVSFVLAGLFFGVAFTWFVFGGRVPKISLNSLLRRRTRPRRKASAPPENP